MKLSVIIPCLNEADTLAVQLEALAEQRWHGPSEVIVADNGSTDGSLAIVQRYKGRLPNLRIADASARRGAAHARNVGAMAATGDALVFCDADDEVSPGWLAAMGEALSKYEFVACRVDLEKLNVPWIEKVFRGHPQQNGLSKLPFPPYLLHAGGGTLGVNRSVHNAICGFDESLVAQEDTDYCFRAQLIGGELHFVPDAVLHVRCPHTFGGLFRQARLWAEYYVLMYKRYRPPGLGIPHPWKRHARTWKYLLWRLPPIRSEEALGGWVWELGWQAGLLQGSLKHRVPPL